MTLAPPDGDASALAANKRQVMGEHKQARWNHPEAEDRQKTEKTASDQSRSCNDTTSTRPRKRDFEAAKTKSAPFGIYSVFTLCQSSNSLQFRRFLVF